MPIKKPEDFDFDREKDIDKRKPKPFRYLKREADFQENNILFDEENTFTIMKTDKTKMKNNAINQVVLSNTKNVGKVEEIIKKHEDIRKVKDIY
jgi:hypothetical protein